jgi:hypothetical protein
LSNGDLLPGESSFTATGHVAPTSLLRRGNNHQTRPSTLDKLETCEIQLSVKHCLSGAWCAGGDAPGAS